MWWPTPVISELENGGRKTVRTSGGQPEPQSDITVPQKPEGNKHPKWRESPTCAGVNQMWHLNPLEYNRIKKRQVLTDKCCKIEET